MTEHNVKESSSRFRMKGLCYCYLVPDHPFSGSYNEFIGSVPRNTMLSFCVNEALTQSHWFRYDAAGARAKKPGRFGANLGVLSLACPADPRSYPLSETLYFAKLLLGGAEKKSPKIESRK